MIWVLVGISVVCVAIIYLNISAARYWRIAETHWRASEWYWMRKPGEPKPDYVLKSEALRAAHKAK